MLYSFYSNYTKLNKISKSSACCAQQLIHPGIILHTYIDMMYWYNTGGRGCTEGIWATAVARQQSDGTRWRDVVCVVTGTVAGGGRG